MIEVDPNGRPSRLELTTAAGLLTLHPSSDGREIHGNVVTTTGEGIRPLAFSWGPEHELEIVGRPLATVIGLHRRRARMDPGDQDEVDVLSIDPKLAVVAARRRFERLTETRWRVREAGAGGPHGRAQGQAQGPSVAEVEIDASGVPLGGVRWPLEPD